MARRIIFNALGGPGTLRLIDTVMEAPGTGEVRIAVGAIGVNRADVKFREGRYCYPPNLPTRFGKIVLTVND